MGLRPLPPGTPSYVLAWTTEANLHRVPQGMLVSLCWCQTFQVAVPTEQVRAGRTLSCGGPGCEPIALTGVA